MMLGRGLTRTMLLAVTVGMMLIGAACCANTSSSFQRAYDRAYGDGAERQASKLLSTTTSTLEPVLVCPVSVSVSTSSAGFTASLVSTTPLSAARLVFASGEVANSRLVGLTGRITSQVTSKLSYIEVVTRDGGKWYFDGYGKWFPDGYTPTVKLEIKNNSVAISSSDLYSRVIVHLSDGSTQEWSTSAYSGTYKPFKSLTLVAVAIVLKSDGSKWYFDAYGALQPLSSKWYTDVD